MSVVNGNNNLEEEKEKEEEESEVNEEDDDFKIPYEEEPFRYGKNNNVHVILFLPRKKTSEKKLTKAAKYCQTRVSICK